MMYYCSHDGAEMYEDREGDLVCPKCGRVIGGPIEEVSPRMATLWLTFLAICYTVAVVLLTYSITS